MATTEQAHTKDTRAEGPKVPRSPCKQVPGQARDHDGQLTYYCYKGILATVTELESIAVPPDEAHIN